MPGIGLQELLNLALALLGIVAPFVAKVIFDKIKDAKEVALKAAEDAKEQALRIGEEAKAVAIRALDELNRHKLHVAEHYVTAPRLESLESKIMDSLKRIEEKLDQKVDKP
jgi:hypothetical protein